MQRFAPCACGIMSVSGRLDYQDDQARWAAAPQTSRVPDRPRFTMCHLVCGSLIKYTFVWEYIPLKPISADVP